MTTPTKPSCAPLPSETSISSSASALPRKNPVKKVAAQFPKKHFAIVDSEVDLPNVRSLMFEEHEGAYLIGAIAALTSKTGKIGFVGGMDIPLIRRFAMGYEAGAKKINPQVIVLANYVGVTSEAWNNPPKGKELAVSQYDAGADVIFAAAGASGLGVFDAAEDRKKFAIGVDANQNWTKPGLILTSMLKRVDRAVYSTIEEAKAGKFTGGVKRFGLANKGIDYAVDQYNANILTEPVKKAGRRTQSRNHRRQNSRARLLQKLSSMAISAFGPRRRMPSARESEWSTSISCSPALTPRSITFWSGPNHPGGE